MSRAFIAAQIVGAAFGITGLWLIGEWHIIVGLLMYTMGNSIQKSIGPKDEGLPDRKDKPWVL